MVTMQCCKHVHFSRVVYNIILPSLLKMPVGFCSLFSSCLKSAFGLIVTYLYRSMNIHRAGVSRLLSYIRI
jgi:hypothetical protein